LLVLVAVSIGAIVWLTHVSLVVVGVPEDQELVAGIFVTLAYGLLSSPFIALLLR
jgi:hypothetical protein